MALDFSKLTSAVKSVADLAASHASISALAEDAKAVAKAAEDKVRAEFADLEGKAQSELDSIVAALEAALGCDKPITTAEAVGVTAVAVALSDVATISPTLPAAPAEYVVPDALPPVAVGVNVDPAPAAAPQTVEEYNAMRAAGLLP
jgi:hypothetical protein